MLSWFRAQVKDHGVLTATRLLTRVVRYRIPVVLSNRILSDKVACPCCGWRGRRFLDYIEVGYHVPNAACPNCDSHSRHRALYLWLTNDFGLQTKNGRALMFAPERALAPLWESAQNLHVLKVDLETARGIDLCADIARLPIVDDCVKLIWCHHVLEQVEDDRAALQELYRVLDPTGGELIVSVGLSENETTREFGRANMALSGNRRRYGGDFGQRLKQAGFQVTPVTCNLSAGELARYAIYPETLYRCTRAR
ncbi:MAG: methyltransferase domain-containing protein [Acidobacteriota bacterium]